MLLVLLLFSGWQPGTGEPEDGSNDESESKNGGKVKKGNDDDYQYGIDGKGILPSVLQSSSFLIITQEKGESKRHNEE